MDKHQPSSPGQRIRQIRSQQSLSRQALAQAAGLTLAAVRRIEHGAYARCEEALAIAQALNVSADELFCGVFERLKQFPSDAVLTDTAWNNQAFRAVIAKYGVDIHPAVWFLKVRFRGGAEETFLIAAPDLDRFHDAVADAKDEQSSFLVFDSAEQTIAINLSEVVHAHSMFEGVGASVAAEEPPHVIQVVLAGEKDPLTFNAEPDVSNDLDDPLLDQGQLHALLMHIDDAQGQPPFASFFDQDGEQVALRVSAIALLTVPHVLLWGAYDEDVSDVPEPPSPSRRPELKLLEGGR